jgi:hypothetical protein
MDDEALKEQSCRHPPNNQSAKGKLDQYLDDKRFRADNLHDDMMELIKKTIPLALSAQFSSNNFPARLVILSIPELTIQSNTHSSEHSQVKISLKLALFQPRAYILV